MPRSQRSSLVRYPGLDTLRALAILAVMLFHLQQFLPAILAPVAQIGWAGVDLFFVLSGFLIGSQLLKPYLAGGTPSLRDFYQRRAFRILPAYLAVLALYLLFPIWREAPGPYGVWQYLSFTWNLFLAGYPDARAFSHVWSLCVEEHFYLVLPALVLLFMRKRRAWRTGALLSFIVLGGMLLRGWLLFHVVRTSGREEDELWTPFMRYLYYPTYTRLDGLVIGVFLALIRTFRPGWWAKLAPYGNAALVCGIGVIGVAVWLFHGEYPSPLRPQSVVFGFPLLSLGFGLLVLSSISDRSVLHHRIPGTATLATLAFSFYLTHKSAVHMARALLPALTSATDWRSAAIYAASCFAIATLLYLLVERPFLALRERRSKAASIPLSRQEVRLDPAL